MVDVIITYPQVQSSMKNWRKEGSTLPRAPKSIEEICASIQENRELNEIFKINDDFFVHIVPAASEDTGISIALLTKSFVSELSSQRKVYGYMDATFKFFPKIFHQLLIIHINVEKHVSVIHI